MKDKLTKRCKRCGNYLIGLARKGTVCNKCLSHDDSGSLTLPYALLGIAGYMVYWMVQHGIFHALTALQGGR